MVRAQVEEAVEPLWTQVAAIVQRNGDLDAEVNEKNLEGLLTRVALRAGAKPLAVEDFVARAKRVFSLVDGNLIAVDANGHPLFSKRSATALLELAEWIDELRSDAPHLFQQETIK
jgi:hypothetical protein